MSTEDMALAEKKLIEQTITPEAFRQLCDGLTIIKGSAKYPKIGLTRDNEIIKFFNNQEKRALSSNKLYPYCKRFAKRSRHLAQKNIEAPKVHTLLRCPAYRYDAVIYPQIQGQAVRDIANDQLLARFAELLAMLHRQGVFFWDIHLANVLITDNDRMALVDISDVRVYNNALSINKRARNIRRFIVIEQKDGHLVKPQFAGLINHYIKACAFSVQQTSRFLKQLCRELDKNGFNELKKELNHVPIRSAARDTSA